VLLAPRGATDGRSQAVAYPCRYDCTVRARPQKVEPKVKCYCCSGEASRFGTFQNKNRVVQRFRCTKCGKTFSEDQPLGRLRVSHDKVVQIVKLLSEGIGIRAVSRLAQCHQHTVLEVLRVVGERCEYLHDRLVRNVTIDSLQVDELWTRVGIRQARTTPEDTERGDQYTFLGIAADTKLIVSYYTGKRNAESTFAFAADAASRIAGQVQITCDSFHPYPSVLNSFFNRRLDLAVMQKIFKKDTYNGSDPNRRYSPAPYASVFVKRIIGAPDETKICTSHIERTNLTVRHFNKRFARLGLGWSRKLDNHRRAVSLFVAVFNFCKVHRTLGTTPAHASGITDGAWTIERLIEEATRREPSLEQ